MKLKETMEVKPIRSHENPEACSWACPHLRVYESSRVRCALFDCTVGYFITPKRNEAWRSWRCLQEHPQAEVLEPSPPLYVYPDGTRFYFLPGGLWPIPEGK